MSSEEQRRKLVCRERKLLRPGIAVTSGTPRQVTTMLQTIQFSDSLSIAKQDLKAVWSGQSPQETQGALEAGKHTHSNIYDALSAFPLLAVIHFTVLFYPPNNPITDNYYYHPYCADVKTELQRG